MNYYILMILSILLNPISSLILSPDFSNFFEDDNIQIVSSPVIEEHPDKNKGLRNNKRYSFKEDLYDLQRKKKYIKENARQRKKTITISFAGDCTLGYDMNFSYHNSFPHQLEIQGNNYGYFFEKVKSIFENDDLTIVNLETTLTTSTKKADKKFRFKGDPSYTNILKEGNIEMVNISNNHIYDYFQKGFLDTINALKDGGILYSGEGHIEYYCVKDITIASLGYRGWHTHIKPVITRDIKEAKEKADIIIVSFHWGNENTYYPNQIQKTLGRFTIDQGADVVVGHHPHVIQGIERYRDKYIVYSLGNFSFGGNKNPKDKDTFIFQNEFTLINKKVVKSIGNIIPCSISSVKHINNYQPTVLENSQRERVMNRIYEYSNRLKYGIGKETIPLSPSN